MNLALGLDETRRVEHRGDLPVSPAVDPHRDPEVAVDVLLQALPYIERFRGSVVVVKFGGNAMASPELFDDFATDVVMMHRVGMQPVVVHGGGPQIGEWIRRLGKETSFVDGRRVTDAETLEIAQMVLIGKVNSDIVTALNTHGPVAVGLTGTDAMLLEAAAHDPELGFVGSVTRVNPELIDRTLAMDLIPVIATIGVDAAGQTYNINADDAATAVAQELGAEKLMFLTDVPGLLADVDDPDSLITEVDHRRGPGPHRGRRDLGRHGPQDRRVHPGDRVRRRVGAPRRRAAPPRAAARAVHQRRRGHDGGGAVSAASAHAAAMGSHAAGERCPIMPTYGATDGEVRRGEGSWLWDREGHRYLDLLSGLAVTSLGHSHPTVAEAIGHQADPPAARVEPVRHRAQRAARAATSTSSSAAVGRCSSATPGPRPTRRPSSSPGGSAAADATWSSAPSAASTAARWPRCTPPANPPSTRRSSRCRRGSATSPGPIPPRSNAALDDTVGAVLLETVQGEGGVNPATAEYFTTVRRLCDERGILFMFDEVQTGLGRCGEWFAHQRLGVTSRRRHHGQGARQRGADRRLLGARRGRVRCSNPVTTPRPSAVSRWRPRRPEPCSR